MKKIFFLTTFVLLLSTLAAQVPLKAVVEHFTNTKCSICASKNPGFYANLQNFPQIIHLSVHPSSPYSACLLSQQNVADNDARTHYYQIYGGTPRLVINGNVISGSANYNAAALFSPYLGQTTPFSLRIEQYKYGLDSIRTSVIVKRVAIGNALTSAQLFVVLAEDTIFYTGSNGESAHYNVCRKSVFAPQGLNISLPLAVGDSVVATKTTTANPIWNVNRLFTIAILQDETTKQVLQSEKTSVSTQNGTLAVQDLVIANVKIYPNPAGNSFSIFVDDDKEYQMEIMSYLGQIVEKSVFQHTKMIETSHLPNGIYLLRLSDGMHIFTEEIQVQH